MALVMTSPLGPKPRAFGVKKRTVPIAPPSQFAPGTTNWTVPYSGRWKFVAWSGGGTGASPAEGGNSGCYAEKTKALAANTVVAIVVGGPSASTTITFPDGTVVTCPAGNGGASAPPTPTGGDVNLQGSQGGNNSGGAGANGQGTGGGAGKAGNGSNTGGGAGAPANLPFRGGDGSSTSVYSRTPGGGGCGVGPDYARGGDGLVIAFMV